MRYGVCIGKNINYIPAAAKAGYDYFEASFRLLSRGTEADFSELKTAAAENAIPCEAANSFIPGDLNITGARVDYGAIKEYVEKGMYRGSSLGLHTVVFGSGEPRSIPNGFSYTEGIRQLAYFLGETVSPIAEKYGITVVTEPLRAQESNMINTVNEAALLSVAVGKDNIKTLADFYHMQFAGDTPDGIRLLKGSILHAHISNPVPRGELKRCFMSPDDGQSYAEFIAALEFAGCPRCSIEASTNDFASDAEKAMRVLMTFK